MTNNPAFTAQDYELTKREICYHGFFYLADYHFRYRLFDGNWSNVISREVLERHVAVGVLPYDPVSDQLVLIEQFRPGVIPTGQNPWLIEIVAGCIEENETPESVARREAIEESGCLIKRLHPIGNYFMSPGGSTEHIHLFCGEINSPSNGIFGLDNEDENIRAFTVSSEEAFAILASGKIKNAVAVIALQWLQLNREQVRKAWTS